MLLYWKIDSFEHAHYITPWAEALYSLLANCEYEVFWLSLGRNALQNLKEYEVFPFESSEYSSFTG